MQQNNPLERRKHKRYLLKENVLVFNEATFGQIINISKGGLSFRYLTQRDEKPLTSFAIGILNGDNGLYLENLRCRTVTVTDTPPIHPSNTTIIRKTGIKFMGLTPEQNKLLAKFIANNSIKEELGALIH